MTLASQRDKEHQAVQRALAGDSYEQIAAAVGYTNRGTAYTAVRRVLERREVEDAAQLRTLEGARLDRLQAAHWDLALAGDPKAATVVLRIFERRAKLFGLDAPVQHVMAEGEGVQPSAEQVQTLRDLLAAEQTSADGEGPSILPSEVETGQMAKTLHLKLRDRQRAV